MITTLQEPNEEVVETPPDYPRQKEPIEEVTPSSDTPEEETKEEE